jgi:hypothetical protein
MKALMQILHWRSTGAAQQALHVAGNIQQSAIEHTYSMMMFDPGLQSAMMLGDGAPVSWLFYPKPICLALTSLPF